MGRITNPTVHIDLNQLRRVVNALIRAYGPPQQIALELARELKLSEDEKKEVNSRNTKNRRMVCDLLDAGHDIAGELLETERFIIHEKVAPGAVPSPDMRFVEDVKRTEDGSRIIRTECIRPQFRAWIATGQVSAIRPPEWFNIPGVPDWVRIVRQHKPTQLTHAAHFALGINWHVGMEIIL